MNCKATETSGAFDPEWSCGYPKAPGPDCQECIFCAGRINPATGKRMGWLRWWLFYEWRSSFSDTTTPFKNWTTGLRLRMMSYIRRLKGGKRR